MPALPRPISLASALSAIAFVCWPAVSSAEPSSGIGALKSVTAEKVNNANDAAIEQTKPNSGATQPPTPPNPGSIHMDRSRKARLMTDGQDLLEQAESVTAHYQPGEGKPSKAELKGSMDQVKADLDSLSELSEMDSLRLQMTMDRLSKLMATLSNLLKKASDTQQGITQNLK
jgi:hypothetical protein